MPNGANTSPAWPTNFLASEDFPDIDAPTTTCTPHPQRGINQTSKQLAAQRLPTEKPAGVFELEAGQSRYGSGPARSPDARRTHRYACNHCSTSPYRCPHLHQQVGGCHRRQVLAATEDADLALGSRH